MKQKKLKAFTLIECIVALALIGFASLLMAQVYGSVSKLNRSNSELNVSLVEQMKIVETQLKQGSNVTITCLSSSYSTTNPAYAAAYAAHDAVPTANIDPVKFAVSGMTGGYNKTAFKATNVMGQVDVYIVKAKPKTTNPGAAIDPDNGKTRVMDEDVRFKFMMPAQYRP